MAPSAAALPAGRLQRLVPVVTVRLLQGDCRDLLRDLPGGSVHCCVTSPPYYGLRDYGVDGQIGLEAGPGEFVEELVAVFREVRRVLRDDGTLWLNLGDTYVGGRNGGIGSSAITSQRNHKAARAAWEKRASEGTHRRPEGLKPKDLIGIPWRVAFALQADGWWLRSDIVWHKPNPMPESVEDRPTRSHEYIFLLSKSERYWYDADAIREPLSPKSHTTYGSVRGSKGGDALGKVKSDNWSAKVRKPRLKEDGTPAGANARDVWTVASQPFAGAHFATFPPRLIEPCVLAGCPAGGTVLDPFGGAGTTGLVADRLGRNAVLIELSPAYAQMARERIVGDAPLIARCDMAAPPATTGAAATSPGPSAGVNCESPGRGLETGAHPCAGALP